MEIAIFFYLRFIYEHVNTLFFILSLLYFLVIFLLVRALNDYYVKIISKIC